uniref:EF-hand domain-containing protein n=1 Tax=Alexandrium monilatum TaxID=311494 RepID=A0A7S4T615_9DINO
MATKSNKTTAQRLLAGGRYDDLLQPGRSAELCRRLAVIFRDDPPVDCGKTNGRTVGLSCAYREKYAKEVFSPDAVVKTLELAKDFWDASPQGNVLQIAVPEEARLIIVGDTHGQLEDVLWMFFKYGLPSSTNRYLFNGDIVDRGGHALEILLLLFAFKRDCADSVHVLRGNHEDSNCVIQYGFKVELESKFPEHLTPVWNACTTGVLPLLPVAAVVSDAAQERRIFVVHGGLPVGLNEQTGPLALEGELSSVRRQRPSVHNPSQTDRDGSVLFNLLWADPADSTDEQAACRSRARKFVEADTSAFCERNGVSCIVRSHEVPKNLRGIMACHSGLCYTVFSASNYAGSTGNRGGVLICSGLPLTLQASEHMAPPWPKLAELLPDGMESGQEERSSAVAAWESDFEISDEVYDDTQGFSLYSLVLWCLGLSAVPEPTTPAPVKASTQAAASQQWMQFMAERLVEHKDELFECFSGADRECSGVLPQQAWVDVMMSRLGPHCEGVLTPRLLEDLYNAWGLTDPIHYVRFLHRFQIRDDPSDGSVLVDRIQVVTQLQARLVDFSSLNLERLLDPNGDKEVTRQEFAAFLPRFHIEVPPWQAAALYETISGIVAQSPITLDSTIMCLALVSQDPPPRKEAMEVEEEVGREILESGMTLAGAFRSWDIDGNGFLSLAELEKGLKTLPVTREITYPQARACIEKIDSMGVPNDRVSVFEFIRGVAPRSMTLTLQRSIIKEVLKRVWICRPALLESLAGRDPHSTNVVSLDAFRECVREVNAQLEQMGLPQLTEIQVGVVCEIAAVGGQEVRYDHFVRGLHVEDTCAT